MQLEFRKITKLDMHYPLTDIQADFEINRPMRYQATEKRNYLHRRTDVAYDNRFFSEKKKKILKSHFKIVEEEITFNNNTQVIDVINQVGLLYNEH